MKNFESDLDAGTSTVVIQESLRVVPQVIPSATYLMNPDDQQWSWDQLRDYVVRNVEDRFGAFPRDARKEAAIFKSFRSRWEERSAAIARYAFEVCDGRWSGAPISLNRFCIKSDPFFAALIVERLVEPKFDADAWEQAQRGIDTSPVGS